MKKTIICLFSIFLLGACSSDDNKSSELKELSTLDFQVKQKINKMKEDYYKSNGSETSFDIFYKNNKEVLDLLDDDKINIVKSIINDKDYISVYYDLKERGLINQDELDLFLNFTKDFDFSKNKEDVILEYKKIFIEKGLYDKYKSFFEGINSLYSIRNVKSDELVYGLKNSYLDSAKDFLTSCGGASVGLGLAFAGLASTGVGAPVALAAAGFVFASGAWGAACAD